MSNLRLYHMVADQAHRLECPGDCGALAGCFPQWTPEEMSCLGDPAAIAFNKVKHEFSPAERRVPRYEDQTGAPASCGRPGTTLNECFCGKCSLIRAKNPDISAERKATPIWSGVLRYFPDAQAAKARLSKKGNDKHNPGEPLHWSRGKSNDHGDCIIRHQLNPDEIDPETGELHAVAVAWRADAQLQLLEEKRILAAGGVPLSGAKP